MSQETEHHKNPARRIADYNIKRLISLAGKLQMETSKEKSLNHAIDYLFDCKAELEQIKKREETNAS